MVFEITVRSRCDPFDFRVPPTYLCQNLLQRIPECLEDLRGERQCRDDQLRTENIRNPWQQGLKPYHFDVIRNVTGCSGEL